MSKKGFDAPRSSTYVFRPEQPKIIGYDTDHGPSHPLYDARVKLPLEEGFVESLRKYGTLQNIGVAKITDVPELLGEPVVIWGRQRVRGCRRVNETGGDADGNPITLEAKTFTGTLFEAIQWAITENEARTDDDMLVKADKARRAVDYGVSQAKPTVAKDPAKLAEFKKQVIAEVATAFTVTPKAIEQWLPLSAAAKEVKDAVSSGVISPTAAATIARLDSKEAQREALDKAVKDGKTSAKDVRRAVNQTGAKGKPAKSGKADDGESGDGVGIISRRVQAKLLEYANDKVATAKEKGEEDVYWAAARDVLDAILGKRTAPKIVTALGRISGEK